MGALIVVLVLAAGLRVFAWSRAVMMMNDGPNFLWQAERFLEGDVLAACSHPYHPLYGLLAAATSLLTDDVVLGALAVSIGSGLLLCVASWGLARAAFGDVPGAPAAAALVAAVATRSLDVTSDIQADGLFAALFLCAVWATVAAARRGGCRRLLALVGLLTGLAYLTRTEGLFALGAPGLWVVAGLAAGGLGEVRRRALRTLPAFALLLVTLAPYVLALHEVSGQWVLSLKPTLRNVGLGLAGDPWIAPPSCPVGWPLIPTGTDEAAGAQPRRPPAHVVETPEEGAFLPRPAWWPVLAQQPVARPGLLVAANRAAFKFVSALRLETLILVVPGLLLLWRRDRRLTLGLLALLAAWLAVCTVQVHRSHFLTNRHMILAIALLLPMAGAGAARLWASGRNGRIVAGACLLVAALAGTQAERTHHRPRLEALAWVDEHTAPDQDFITHRLRDGWYAKRRAITARFPVRDVSVEKILREQQVSVLVLDLEDVERHAPHWVPWGYVEELARFGEGDETVVIYEPRFPL